MQYLMLAVTTVSLAVSTYAAAATFQWRDSEGVTHFTDNADAIPTRYQNRVKETPSLPGEVTKSSGTAKAEAPAAQAPGAVGRVTAQGDSNRLLQEIALLQERLAGKRKELAQLRHKWVVAKGRKPTDKEIEEFDRKRKEGKETFEDNPYVNKNPLSSPGRSREAYFRKLEEVRRDEERLTQLEGGLTEAAESLPARRQ